MLPDYPNLVRTIRCPSGLQVVAFDEILRPRRFGVRNGTEVVELSLDFLGIVAICSRVKRKVLRQLWRSDFFGGHVLPGGRNGSRVCVSTHKKTPILDKKAQMGL